VVQSSGHQVWKKQKKETTGQVNAQQRARYAVQCAVQNNENVMADSITAINITA